ncbi:MAG: excinuclease ABC subunit UvrC [Gammaproteobacteria bacterium]|nr:MAG: excinuclease ABC subunit UvrC [Gammaproteobacteria bacterium]
MTISDPRGFLKSTPSLPGVYRMEDQEGLVLYVGKARNLHQRLSSYFREQGMSPKTRALMAETAQIHFTLTHTEKEALILEHNLIKKYRPRFNVIFRDDKSYPYLYVSTRHPSPGFSLYRGSKKNDGRYLGPYPGAGGIRNLLNQIQKIFRVRTCEDSFFRNRSRPCLQYQIRRCSAPCVGAITESEYRKSVENALDFLEGRRQELLDALISQMERYSHHLEFEKAAQYRDQIRSLQRVRETQVAETGTGDLDVIVCDQARGEEWVVELLTIRQGMVLGSRTFYPRNSALAEQNEVVESFIFHHYAHHPVPREIILQKSLQELVTTWPQLQSDERQKKTPKISCPRSGIRKQWLLLAERNLQHAVNVADDMTQKFQHRWKALTELLGMPEPLNRVECYDVSHISGTETIGAGVVFDADGAQKSMYRRYHIRDVTPGDDYAAMEQMLHRRFTGSHAELIPDVILVDGGKGQLARAEKTLSSLSISTLLVGVAKGPERIAGNEMLYFVGEKEPLRLDSGSSAFLLIQQIRDEAHRFAVTGHRQGRRKKRRRSLLEDIPGIGAKRRRDLLNYFGGLREVAAATETELMKVNGINRHMANRIYQYLHEDSARP